MMNSSETAVREVLGRLYEAWADNDADAFADLYVEDATVVMPGMFHQGRPAVRDFMAKAFAGPLKGSRGIDEPQDIRVDGDTAVIVSKAGIIMAGEEELPSDRERIATWVLSRRDGRWLVSAYANAPAN
ncbi:SgcJ/EcaC family oxidoreductase [Actinomadura darangshiensis]|uniref:SgcJ/EcaC family oxidoreductase n=1 Tax=Actinomadura darangshiensis TaxID=705336 RepID=A0A4R5BPT3_9ACTN|nr:SgcJ/EcaC family oxidoreductase [Actinomadura darangshiensis]TDD87945.1 SgcJ/EcaC family oxidoreductase [Actinomadura darangshiensis]